MQGCIITIDVTLLAMENHPKRQDGPMLVPQKPFRCSLPRARSEPKKEVSKDGKMAEVVAGKIGFIWVG